MLFSWFELLLIIGVTQGLITSLLLLTAKDDRGSKRLLAFVLISYCIISVKMVFNTLYLAKSYPLLGYFPLATELAIAPLCYLYSISLISPKFKFSLAKLVHFVPFSLFMGYALFIFLNVVSLEHAGDKQVLAQFYNYALIKKVEDYLTVLSILGYLTYGYFQLKIYRQKVRDNISDSRCPVFSWLRNIFILSALLVLVLIINMLLDCFFKLENLSILHWKMYFIYIGCIIYYLGFKGYKLPVINFDLSLQQQIPENSKVLNKLSAEKINHIAIKFKQKVLDNKLYLNPTLSTQELAKELGVSQSHLSAAINQYFGINFRDYINKLRIHEVKTKLLDNTYQDVSILAIALESGFNSEASFYRIFKKNVGMSPKDFSSQSKSY